MNFIVTILLLVAVVSPLVIAGPITVNDEGISLAERIKMLKQSSWCIMGPPFSLMLFGGSECTADCPKEYYLETKGCLRLRCVCAKTSALTAIEKEKHLPKL